MYLFCHDRKSDRSHTHTHTHTHTHIHTHTHRHLVGLLANNGELSASAAIKGAHFIQMCTQRGIPLLFLQNTLSDAQFLSETGNDGTTVKARAQMMATLACSSVPKITVVMGGSYGPTSYAMVGTSSTPMHTHNPTHPHTTHTQHTHGCIMHTHTHIALPPPVWPRNAA